MRSSAVLTAACLLALASAPPALASHGSDDDGGSGGGGGGARGEVRATGSCGSGASAKLKLKGDDGAIEVEFEVDHHRAGEVWRVTLARGGRVLHRSSARTAGRSGSFSFERRISDLAGADRVTARAVGPRGITCTAAATLASR